MVCFAADNVEPSDESSDEQYLLCLPVAVFRVLEILKMLGTFVGEIHIVAGF